MPVNTASTNVSKDGHMTNATGLTLSAFLLARIEEDEAAAQAAAERNGGEWTTEDLDHSGWRIEGTASLGNPRSYPDSRELWDDEGAMGMWAETAQFVVRFDPARVLAECEAKRRIVEEHPDYSGYGHSCATCAESSIDLKPWPCPTLLALANVYADHEDYWRVAS